MTDIRTDGRAIRWPRTVRGWRTLLLLSVHRCPIHRTPLVRDFTLYDTDDLCFSCEGVGLWPRNGLEALRQNHRACLRDEEKAQMRSSEEGPR